MEYWLQAKALCSTHLEYLFSQFCRHFLVEEEMRFARDPPNPAIMRGIDTDHLESQYVDADTFIREVIE